MDQVAQPTTDRTDRGVVAATGGLQVLVVVLAACLPLRADLRSLPLSTIAAAALVGLATVRPAITRRRGPRLVVLAGAGVVAWMVAASAAFGALELRRAGNLLILLALAWVLGQGRLHMNSFVAGLGAGWLLGIAHAVLTRDESTYDGRITGFFGDPNGAGFVIVTLGCVLIAYLQPLGRRTWPVWGVMAVATALTLSRTSAFALAAATVWALLGPRLGRWASMVAVAVAWPVYQWLVQTARAAGFFSERAGSDDLRRRLKGTEALMVDRAGWHGMGLGTAKAEVDGAPLWFHNSYWALWVEGGFVAFGLLVLGLLALFWSIHQVPSGRRNTWYEAALLAALICSVNIGFSLTSVTMAVAVGTYLLYWRQSVEEPDADGPAGLEAWSPFARSGQPSSR